MTMLWHIFLSGLCVLGILAVSFSFAVYLISKQERDDMESKRAQVN